MSSGEEQQMAELQERVWYLEEILLAIVRSTTAAYMIGLAEGALGIGVGRKSGRTA